MKRIIKANYDNYDTLIFAVDDNERKRYIHTLIGDLQSILNSKGIKVHIYDIDYSLIIDILGNFDKNIIDTVTIPYNEITYDWDDIYYVATTIADTVREHE